MLKEILWAEGKYLDWHISMKNARDGKHVGKSKYERVFKLEKSL